MTTENIELTEILPRKLTKQHIGRLGELLVQYELLRYGIDSAPLTTDAGIDLVAYSPNNARSFTIQVKANLAPKPGGGKGAFAVDWWVSEDCPAQLFAFADISTRRVWILTKRQLASAAQQKSSGRLHFYMRTDSDSGLLGFERHGDAKFSRLLLENRVAKLFDSLLSYRELNPLLENLK